MTNPNLSEVICIIDRSGSMGLIKDDAIGGFNAFLETQQTQGAERCNLTYAQFDTEYEMVHECKPIRSVEPIDGRTYQPRGATALLDAVGKTIDDVGARLRGLPEYRRPGNVVVVILTDGMENSSTAYTKSQIKEMVQRQHNKYDWQFVYLGANQDAFAEAGGIGISAMTTVNFVGEAVMDAYDVVAHNVATFTNTSSASDLSFDVDIIHGTAGPVVESEKEA